MNRDGHNDVSFFVGTEVEHTPAFGLRTLFVVGPHNPQLVETVINNYNQEIEHIYFGANQSFPTVAKDDSSWNRWMEEWEYMVRYFLDRDRLCTLDFDASYAEDILETPLVEYHNFIPMISVKLPYIRQFGYNATIKLDDKDFKATNPGVWCHSLHDLQNSKMFTDWSKYTKDEVIK